MGIPKVSVIVPGHNAAEMLQSSLRSLRSQDWPKDCLEIIYVDDASTDGSAVVASEWADHIVKLEKLRNGPAGARNSGARESTGQILIFMDADVLAPPETISALVKPLMEDELLDAVFGSYDSEPFDLTLVSQYRNLLHHFVHQTSRQDASTFWAGCGAIRRTSFEMVGGFDAGRYRGAMIEDIELGHRMRALGMRIRLQPSIQVKHLKRWTLYQMVRADIFSRGIPWMRLLFQDSRASREIGDLNLKVPGILSVVLAWLGAVFLLLSFWFPKCLYALFPSFGLIFVLNWPIYRFFFKMRGIRFTLMIVPLHVLYHLYNGASVIGGLFYRCTIDKPLPGLKSIGNSFRKLYSRYREMRRESEKSPHS
jgi:glycosyltransferase involved in cell wall biosynthesis